MDRAMLHRIVQVYLVLSAILFLSWIGFTALLDTSDINPGAIYCDYHVAGQPGAGGERFPEANWAALGGPCRLRIGGIVAEFGPIYLNFLVMFQWPAYMYLIIRHLLRLDQRAREAGTDPGTWLRGKWRALVKPVLFRVVRVYLFVSAILLLTVIGIVTLDAVSFNLDGLYCDHDVAGQAGVDAEGLPEANWSVGPGPCRLRVWNIFVRLIFPMLLFLAAVQSPAYVYLLTRHVRWRPGGAGTNPWAWLRSKWPTVKKTILLRIVQVYLILSAIAVPVWGGYGTAIMIDNNKDAQYCNYYVKGYPGKAYSDINPEGLPEANWSVQGEPCELRGWNVFSYFGVIVLIVLAAVQSPAYLFLIVRYVFRRWRGADAQAQGP